MNGELFLKKTPRYIKWVPIDSIPNRMYCEAIHDDYEGFRILLKGENSRSKTLRMFFESILAYRNVDEGYMLRTLESIKDREIFPLYTVHNSIWLRWFHEESYNIVSNKMITHYSIVTPNDIIDILSEFEPIVEWLND